MPRTEQCVSRIWQTRSVNSSGKPMRELPEGGIIEVQSGRGAPQDDGGASREGFEERNNAQKTAVDEKDGLIGALRGYSPESIFEMLGILLQQLASERGRKIAEIRPRREAFAAKAAKMAIKTKGKIILIDPADMMAVEAEGNHVVLRRECDSYLLRQSISNMEAKLKGCGFVRIHRSVLVNASWVEEIRPSAARNCLLVVSGKKEYTVSRTYKKNLKCLAESWIGTDASAD
jgi:LytTr DNA-binding domain